MSSTISISDTQKTIITAAVTSVVSVVGAVIALSAFTPTAPVGATTNDQASDSSLAMYTDAYTQGYLAHVSTVQSGAQVLSCEDESEGGRGGGATLGASVETHQSGAVLGSTDRPAGGSGAGTFDPEKAHKEWKVTNNYSSESYVNSNNNSGNVSGSHNETSSSTNTTVDIRDSKDVEVDTEVKNEVESETWVDNSTKIEESGNTDNSTEIEESFNTENKSEVEIDNKVDNSTETTEIEESFNLGLGLARVE